MQRTYLILIGALLALTGGLSGQSGRGLELRQPGGTPPPNGPLSAPVMGFASADESLAVEAIIGVPGASLLSERLALPPGVSSIRFAPGQRYAIVGQAGGAAVLAFSGAVAGTPAAIAGASAPDLVVFSPTGRSALLHTPEPRLQVVTGLPDAAQIARDFDPDALDPSLSFAVSDDGSLVLASNGKGVVFLLGTNGSATPLWTASRQSAMAFLPASHNAVICDAAAGRFVMLQNVDQNPSSWIVADGVAGLGTNVNLAVTHDGKRLLADAPDAGRITIVDLETQQLTAATVSAAPARLDALRITDTFLLSAEDGMPAWILDAGGGQAVISFVGRPAARGRTFGSASHGPEKEANQ